MWRAARSKWQWIALAGVAAASVGGAALLWGDGTEQAALDDAARATLPNERFVRLSGGITHYQWQGPENGKKVVLIHGYSSPYFIWDRTIPALAAEGFRVLRFDLFGRGLSDRLPGEYAADVFDRQLLDLLDTLGVNEPVDLVGLSMGGAIATRFTDRHPERVRRLVLIGTAGVTELPLFARLVRTPYIGECLLKGIGDYIVTHVMPREVADDPQGVSNAERAYASQLRYSGYKHALLSTLRSGPLTGLDETFARVGHQNKSGLLLWGTRDTVVPYKVHERVQQLIPWLDFHPIDGARHCANYERPEQVNRILVDFLAT